MGHAQSPESVSVPHEAAPAYDHLFEQRPSNPITGYSHVPNTDQDHDIEHHGHEHEGHGHSHNHTHHNHTHELAPFQPSEPFNDPPPAPFTDSAIQATQPHFHCEVCDSRQERRERRKKEERCCLVVAYTFVAVAGLIFFSALIFFTSAGKDKKQKS